MGQLVEYLCEIDERAALAAKRQTAYDNGECVKFISMKA
jgi:hypothetical protein